MTLKVSSDRKTANAVTAGGNVPFGNAFGLPAGSNGSCRDVTSVCAEICYAERAEGYLPNVSRLVRANYEYLLTLDYAGMVDALSGMVAEFERKSDKRGADKFFRIHWDGDFFSMDYTRAWIDVVRAFPAVQFWLYTRSSASAVAIHKASLENVSLYFSADRVNAPIAQMLSRTYGIRVAMLGSTFQEARAALEEATGSAGKACPENGKRLALISPKGSACARCKLCIYGRADIAFSITGK